MRSLMPASKGYALTYSRQGFRETLLFSWLKEHGLTAFRPCRKILIATAAASCHAEIDRRRVSLTCVSPGEAAAFRLYADRVSTLIENDQLRGQNFHRRIRLVRPGAVFVWEEEEAGIRRWTDHIKWSRAFQRLVD